MHRWSTRAGACALVTLLVISAAACTRTKKLTGGDAGVWDGLVHGVLNLDRDAQEYYAIVRGSHDQRFRYRVSEDEFLIDKTVDAVQRLGQLEYERLEGEAQVFDLLADVLLDDPSALAQANAANSLTRLTVKLPPTEGRRVPERGDRFLARLRELDGLFSAAGRARTNPAAARARAVTILREIGSYAMPNVPLAKDAMKPFYTRTYLVDTPDTAMRRAADMALVARMRDTAVLALRAGVDDTTAYVREESVRGLKTLGDRGAEKVVLARLAEESRPRVRSEMAEYLGVSQGPDAVAALLPMLEDGDPSLRLKARQALTRIAGRDLGIRRATWTRWARSRYPQLAASSVSSQPSGPVR